MLSDTDIERRAPVWHALSELFLDTELGEAELREIAAEIQRHGFNAAEAEQILRGEVAPVFWGNLYSTAGEWQPWSREETVAMVVKHMRAARRWWQRSPFISGLISDIRTKPVRADWQRVKAFLAH